MSVAPHLAAALELAYIRGELRVFENKPPPQSGPCLQLKKGGGGGAYFRDNTVHYVSQILALLADAAHLWVTHSTLHLWFVTMSRYSPRIASFQGHP